MLLRHSKAHEQHADPPRSHTFRQGKVLTNSNELLYRFIRIVQIGIGYGRCALLYVGGVFGRSESFTIGEALMWALRSEGQAEGGGQIIVAEAAFQHVREFFRAKEIVDETSADRD